MLFQFKLSLFTVVHFLLAFSNASWNTSWNASSTSNASCSAVPANLTGTGLAAPSLKFDFHMKVNLNTPISVGAATWGTRTWISFSGGSFKTCWKNGTTGTVAVRHSPYNFQRDPWCLEDTVLITNALAFHCFADNTFLQKPSGQDANVAPLNPTIANGTWLDTNYLLTTDDEVPAHLLIRTNGWSTADSWRLYIRIETGDKRYYFLNTRMWVGALTGVSEVDGVTAIEYDAYRIL